MVPDLDGFEAEEKKIRAQVVGALAGISASIGNLPSHT